MVQSTDIVKYVNRLSLHHPLSLLTFNPFRQMTLEDLF